jgi:GT2 family glycosyltransferase
MKFSLIVVNYNAGARIKRCMEALAAQTHKDFEVIMVDNASSDGSGNTPVPDERFHWILSDKNLGFAAGNNLAAREAKGEWLFLVNPDAYAEEDCLAKLHAATLRHPNCVLFGCTQLDDKVPEILDGSGDAYFFAGLPWRGGKDWPIETLPDEGETFGPCGAAYLIRKDVFDSAGGFDEDFFCYCEEVDLNFRLRLQGYYAIQVVEAMVRHEGSGISGAHSYFSVFHGTRNCLWVFVKNMPSPLFWILLPFHIAITFLLLCNPRYFKPRWEGLNAALQKLPVMLQRRKMIQKNRKASLWQIAKALTWNPWTFFWRKTDIRPVK